jgi:hypothetical protein
MHHRLALLQTCLANSCLVWLTSLLAVGQTPLVDLSPDEYRALERITQADVTGTLSFLASDALQGRGTGTQGLEVASAYVASRLRAVEAVGLGPEGSYYLESTLEGRLATNAGLRIACRNQSLTASVLQGGAQTLRFAGKLEAYGSDESTVFHGPVLWRADHAVIPWPLPMTVLRNEVARLKRQGATALILQSDETGVLWDTARSRQVAPRIGDTRGAWPLPVVVVDVRECSAIDTWELDIPAEVEQAITVRNVAAVLPGSDPQWAQQAVLFSAHMDHLGSGAPGPDAIYNGADDDASGVTAVLTLAEAFAALPTRPKRSVIFVGFWGEELGLLGSKQFVEDAPWPLARIVANVNIEMIGRPEANAENRMWMTGWEHSDLGAILNEGSRRVGVETFEHASFSARLYRASDNYSLVQAGVIAHSFSAGSLHSDYHQPSDEWDKMNLPHMTQVIRGLFAGTLPIAHAERTPRKAAQP